MRTELSFISNGTSGAMVGEAEETFFIQTDTIDNLSYTEPVTFIKLDVEGAELNALVGAKVTIRTHHPRLAICVYHKAEDIFTIPDYVLSISDDYKIYLRHYQLSQNETVLYAI